jgi:hypothetical protein
MPFQKGHKLARGGRRPGAGRKPNVVREMVESGDFSAAPDVAEVVDQLRHLALHGASERVQVQACIAYLDRKLGKPRQTVETDAAGAAPLLIDDFA